MNQISEAQIAAAAQAAFHQAQGFRLPEAEYFQSWEAVDETVRVAWLQITAAAIGAASLDPSTAERLPIEARMANAISALFTGQPSSVALAVLAMIVAEISYGRPCADIDGSAAAIAMAAKVYHHSRGWSAANDSGGAKG